MKSGLSKDAINSAAKVNEARLWDMIQQLAQFGARDDGGVCRHALSDEDIAARQFLIDWAIARNYQVSVDDAANLFFRRPGSDSTAEPVLTGSHMDSQPAGGKFDGAWGVLAGLEALTAMDDAGIETKRPIDVVAWTNEEGGRFARSCTGSSIWSGATKLEDFSNDIGVDGVMMKDAFVTTLAATAQLPKRDFNWNAYGYIECHIEQGPVLEGEELDVAAVSSIQGAHWMAVEIEGENAHAGTTPLTIRKDAVQAMVRAIAALNELMNDPQDIIRFTVGRVVVEPNSPNTVADKVSFTIDLRHPDGALLQQKSQQIAETLESAIAPCTFRIVPTTQMAPVVFPDNVVSRIENTAKSLDIKVRQLASGAFHDALYVNKKCPSGMIFIPCRNGLSHHPAEWAEPHHCASGTKVLTACLVDMANE